ncbi:MAG: YggS family pyridoxal phosphate-dependent enzyme [Anaerolineaceae bacterium]|nr:YggS family pyridoxal phosphate-dependent enzyme [Anaerolineaceae bacterium]
MSREREIANNIDEVQEQIALACARAGRSVDDVKLVAVSKTKPIEDILAATKVGIRDFGENRIEEASEKIPAVNDMLDQTVVWHMIGHIQSRKARDVVPLFASVHSVDSLKIARKLSSLASEEGKTLNVFAEVNVSGEPQKYGFEASNWQIDAQQFDMLQQTISQIAQLPGLKLVGLMTMAPFVSDAERTRPVFASMAALRSELASKLAISLPHLSMGMTNDYTVAIEEGATMVRVGTAIFGARNT